VYACAPACVCVCACARTRVCVNVDVRIRTELLERALEAGIQGHQIEADGCSSSASVFLSSEFYHSQAPLSTLDAFGSLLCVQCLLWFEDTSNPPCSCLHSSIPAQSGARAEAGAGVGRGAVTGRRRGEDFGGMLMFRPGRV
jgi:hypothetical protein